MARAGLVPRRAPVRSPSRPAGLGLLLVADAGEFKAFEAEGWSAQASSYDRLMGRVTDRVAESLLDLAGVSPGDRVLDVATGTGAVAAAAVARGAEVTGVDISVEMLAVARERVPEAHFVAGDAEQLEGVWRVDRDIRGESATPPDPEGGFDVVVAGFLINHLPHPKRAVRGWAHALAPRGRLALSLWDRPERNRLFGLIGDAIGELEGEDAVPEGPDPYRFAGHAELEALLGNAGLAEPQAQALLLDQRVESAAYLWEGLRGGTVRSSARIEAQPEAEQRRMRADLERLCAQHREGDALSVPVAVILGAASRSPA